MATPGETTVREELTGSEWRSWIAALLGLWVLVSPFVLSGSITEGAPFWSNVVTGILVTVLASYGAYSVGQKAVGIAAWPDWLAALVGLWVLVSPFLLRGAITEGTPYWSNIVAGLVILLLAAYSVYEVRGTR